MDRYTAGGFSTGPIKIEKENIQIEVVLFNGIQTNIYLARDLAFIDDKGKWPEHNEQVALVNILRASKIAHHSIPNGGARDKIVAVNMIREGLSAGVPDLYVIGTPKKAKLKGIPLAIELKRRNGRVYDVDEKQWKWLKTLSDHGWLCIVGFGYIPTVVALEQAGYDLNVNKTDIMLEAIANE